MARVSGILILKVVPMPASVLRSTVPPIRSTLVLTTSMPTPRPDTLLTLAAVEKPGLKMRLTISCSLILATCSAVTTPFSTALAARACASIPLPSSEISMLTWPPSWLALGATAGPPRASRPPPARPGLDAVVDRVADDVGQRVLDGLDDRAVELGLLADHLDLDRLVELTGQVPHDPGELGPDVVDGLHPGLHHPFLQLAGDQVEPLGWRAEPVVVGIGGQLDDLVAGQHQLTDQVHQPVEEGDVDPDRALGRTLALLGGRRLFDVGLLGSPVVDQDLAELPVDRPGTVRLLRSRRRSAGRRRRRPGGHRSARPGRPALSAGVSASPVALGSHRPQLRLCRPRPSPAGVSRGRRGVGR